MSRPAYPASIKLNAARVLLLMIFVGHLPGVAFAGQADEKGEWDDRWIPSIAFTVGFTSQRFEGTAESNNVIIGIPTATETRPDAAGQQYLNAIHAGGVFELQTPPLPIAHLRPRIFFGGEIHNVSSQSRKIAREGNPQPVPEDPPGVNPFNEEAILGVGSQTTVDADNIQIGAHIGLSFPVQFGDWQVAIKPSARYLKQEVFITGIVSDGERNQFDPRSIPTNFILMRGSESLDIHAVGPALEIEIEAGGVRSLAASLFISGGAYRVLTDTSVDFSNLGFGSNPPPFTRYLGRWTAELDPWIYRASVGMRIKWTGAGRGWLLGLDGR